MPHDSQAPIPYKAVLYWLYFNAFMVFAMVVIGAITRLTESGLSMVEWEPFIGAIPPLNEAEWERVFGLYRQTPEFIHKNSWMNLDDFKTIFFWEWFHRLWGRLIGLTYALPLVWFWVKGQIPHGFKMPFVGLLLLGGAQGFMGWFMVMSGLVDEPAVSHFRLAAHLVLAFVIFCALVWVARDVRLAASAQRSAPGSFCLKRHGWIALGFITVTIVWGAFVAGKDGGLLYNTWPMMDAHWVPPEVTGLYALTHDPAALQFFHRWIAIVATIFVLSFAWRVKNPHIAGMVFLQVGLGIATILTQVSIVVATLHQAGALILLYLLVKQLHILHRGRPLAGDLPVAGDAGKT